MNLLAAAIPAVSAVNPETLATWQQSIGNTLLDGVATPTYNTVTNVPVNVQGVSSGDLKHLDNLNIQGVLRKVYLYGKIDGVERPNMEGGDLLTFPQTFGGTPQVWLVLTPSEAWPDAVASGWSSAIVVLQNDVQVVR